MLRRCMLIAVIHAGLVLSLATPALAQDKKTGTVIGEVKSNKEFPNGKNNFIEVLAFGEEKARPYFVLFDEKAKGPIPEVIALVRTAKVGDHVKLTWEYTAHGPAIKSFQILKKEAALPPPPDPIAVCVQPKSVATTPAPRLDNKNWADRHKKFNDIVAKHKGKVDLVFIGDSITQGWEGAGKEAWAKHYGQKSAVNLGIGGDQTQHVLWRLQNGNLEGIEPKLAVIMIGTNNAKGSEAEDTAAGIKLIVQEIQKRTPKTKILLLAIFPRGKDADDPLRKKNDKVNSIIKGYADAKHVYFLDIGKSFLQDDGTLPKEIMPDLLHLSPKGYQIWADSIEKKVTELMGG
jgi:lysophospholipase L1-like esterase